MWNLSQCLSVGNFDQGNEIMIFVQIRENWILVMVNQMKGEGRILDFKGRKKEDLLKLGTVIKIVLKEKFQILPFQVKWNIQIYFFEKNELDNNWGQVIDFLIVAQPNKFQQEIVQLKKKDR